MKPTSLALLLALGGCATTGSATENTPRARPAAFAVPRDVAGANPWDPAAAEGRVLAVIFVASWCFPCLAELGVMQKLQDKLGARGLTTVAVAMDLEGHRVLDPFAQATGGTVPIVIADEALRKGDSPYGQVKELPTRYLFNRDGTLLAAWSGLADPEKLEAMVTEAVDRKP